MRFWRAPVDSSEESSSESLMMPRCFAWSSVRSRSPYKNFVSRPNALPFERSNHLLHDWEGLLHDWEGPVVVEVEVLALYLVVKKVRPFRIFPDKSTARFLSFLVEYASDFCLFLLLEGLFPGSAASGG